MSDDNVNQSDEYLIELSELTDKEQEELRSIIETQFGEDWRTMFSDNEPPEAFEMPEDAAENLHNRLMTSLNRDTLVENGIKFGTSAFVEFLKAIMRPVFNSRQSK